MGVVNNIVVEGGEEVHGRGFARLGREGYSCQEMRDRVKETARKTKRTKEVLR